MDTVPTMEVPHVSARIGALIVHAAESAGVDAVRFAAEMGFDPAVVRDPDARIPLELEERLWDEAARRSGVDSFGLRAAQSMRPGAFDVLDYAVRTAPTLRAALERLARYNRLVHDVARFTLVDREATVRVEHRFSRPGLQPCRQASEFTIASIVAFGSALTAKPVRPLTVEFIHEAPSSSSAHRMLFGLEPRFSSAVNAIELDRETVEREIPGADPALSAVIERHAEALLAGRPEIESTAQRVRRELASMLRDGDASLVAAAKRVGMSARSLQRRLADEGLSFDAVLDDLRRELALRYLADPRIAIAEVAYLTGFSEPSAFHRAFKRWTGTTPGDARRQAA